MDRIDYRIMNLRNSYSFAENDKEREDIVNELKKLRELREEVKRISRENRQVAHNRNGIAKDTNQEGTNDL